MMDILSLPLQVALGQWERLGVLVFATAVLMRVRVDRPLPEKLPVTLGERVGDTDWEGLRYTLPERLPVESVPSGVVLELGLIEAVEEGNTLSVTEEVAEGVLLLDRMAEMLAARHPLGNQLRLGDKEALRLRVIVPVTVPLLLREDRGKGLGDPLLLRVRLREPVPHPVPLPLTVGRGKGRHWGWGRKWRTESPSACHCWSGWGGAWRWGSAPGMASAPALTTAARGGCTEGGKGGGGGGQGQGAGVLGEGVPWELLEAQALALGEQVGDRDPEGRWRSGREGVR